MSKICVIFIYFSTFSQNRQRHKVVTSVCIA